MKSGLIIAALTIFSAGSYSVQLSAQERSAAQSLNAFLSSQEERNAARYEALRVRNLDASVGMIIKNVRAGEIVLPSPPPETPPLVREALQRVFAQDLAQYALALGLDESDLQRDTGALRSVSRIMRGQAGIEDYIVAADTIVIAVAAGKDLVPQNDGYLSGHRFVVLESLKGAANRENKIVLRQRSGSTPDGLKVGYSNDISPVQGRKYLLFLSRSYYLQSSLEHNIHFVQKSRPGTVTAMLIAGAYEIHPSTIKSISPMAPTIDRLDELKEKIHSVSINRGVRQ